MPRVTVACGRGVAATAVVLLAAATGTPASAQTPHVLLVGPAGTPGVQFTSIQDAVDHASAGDWVLVAPGVYHEKGYSPTANPQGKPQPAEVYVSVPDLHIRGMNRDSVIVDGTNLSTTQAAGTAPPGSRACPSDPALQDPGVKQAGGGVEAREGIMVWQAAGVSIENLTSCNSMDNEIWWNNGDGTGHETPMALHGDYITGTSTFYKDANSPSAQYGIFTSDVEGPGVIDHSYASNMTDSAYYVGACRNCNVVLERPHAENSALGLSSTNAGGNLIVENGEWDLNRTGLVSNAQNNDDFPSPQYGQCVPPASPPTGAGPDSCYVMRGNYIHDNNNANTPGVGLTAVSAVGTGVELAATQHISVIDNRIENNGSWGVVVHDLPDPESGPAKCHGGIDSKTPAGEVCTYFSRGNFVSHNRFDHNGFFGNPTNADVGNEATGALWAPSDAYGGAADPNCFTADSDTSGAVSSDPPTLESAPCGVANSDTADAAELVCATGATSLFAPGVQCPAVPGAEYPKHDGRCVAPAVLTPAGDHTNGVCFLPLGYTLNPALTPPMPDPCAGVPVNAWCPASPAGSGVAAAVTEPQSAAGGVPAAASTPNTAAPERVPPWAVLAPVAFVAGARMGGGRRRRRRRRAHGAAPR